MALYVESLTARKFSHAAKKQMIMARDTIQTVNRNVEADYRYMGQPNDANEMLCQFFASFKDDARVESIFGFCFLSTVECAECHVQSYTRQKTNQVEATDLTQMHTLKDVFAKTFLCDDLKGDNAYACETCRKNSGDKTKTTVARRFLKTEKLPPILTIQFLRFDVMTDRKIMQAITFPQMFKTDGGEHYQLLFAILHQGASRQGGHYTAVGRLSDTTFMTYNDAFCHVVDASYFLKESTKQEVYMLFYQKL